MVLIAVRRWTVLVVEGKPCVGLNSFSKFSHFKIYFYYKIAFQWDAYRPLVDRISQYALLRWGAWS